MRLMHQLDGLRRCRVSALVYSDATLFADSRWMAMGAVFRDHTRRYVAAAIFGFALLEITEAYL